MLKMNEQNKKDESVAKNSKEEFYDKIPLTFKQVDIITKVLIAIFIILMIYLVFFE